MLRLTTFLVLVTGTIFAGQLFGAIPSVDSDYSINGYEVALVLHELLFVFWLGPDIGVYIWSRKAADPSLTPEQRLTAAGMMHTIDVMPRVCISLMLTVGGILTEVVGIEHPWWQMTGIVLLGPVWLTIVVVAYVKEGTSLGSTVDRLDTWMRWLLVVAVSISVIFSTVTDRLVEAPWVGWKLLLFVAILLFGQFMRLRLRPFMRSLKTLGSEGPSDAVNAVMATSLARARPFVFAIWIALIVAAALGVIQPVPGGGDAIPAVGSVNGNVAAIAEVSQ